MSLQCVECAITEIYLLLVARNLLRYMLLFIFFGFETYRLIGRSLEPQALVQSQIYARYVPKIPKGRTHYPTTPVTSTAISPVKMSIGRKSHTNLRSEMIFLQGKHFFFYIVLQNAGKTKLYTGLHESKLFARHPKIYLCLRYFAQ